MAHQGVLNEVIKVARNYLRDFPKFFQVSFEGSGRTYELGQPNVDGTTLWVATTTGGSATTLTSSQYSLDERNGMLRLHTTPSPNTTIMVEGYYYEWLLPADLQFYAERAINYHTVTVRTPLEDTTQVVIDTVGLGALVETLQALMTEYARDIDVMTSESIHIPGSQRFRMLQSLVQMWEAEYRKHANNLNIGPERIDVMNLRRVSRTTNRLVPLYISKEIGDYGPIERIFKEKEDAHLPIEDEGDDLRTDIYLDTTPPRGYVTNTFL
jgi:hypothetical protein